MNERKVEKKEQIKKKYLFLLFKTKMKKKTEFHFMLQFLTVFHIFVFIYYRSDEKPLDEVKTE